MLIGIERFTKAPPRFGPFFVRKRVRPAFRAADARGAAHVLDGDKLVVRWELLDNAAPVSAPGDGSGVITPWLLQETRYTNLVVTLSQTVTDLLIRARGVPADEIIA